MRRLTWAVGRGFFAVFNPSIYPHAPLLICESLNEVRDFIEEYELEQVKI